MFGLKHVPVVLIIVELLIVQQIVDKFLFDFVLRDCGIVELWNCGIEKGIKKSVMKEDLFAINYKYWASRRMDGTVRLISWEGESIWFRTDSI